MTKLFSAFKRSAYATLAVGMLLSLGACDKDKLKEQVEPKKSTDQRLSKAHGDPVRAELTLYSGHLHGIMGFHQNADIQGLKHMKRVQTMHLSYMSSGKQDKNGRDIYTWAVVPGPGLTDKFRVEYGVYHGKDEDHPERMINKYAHVYGLLIRYFDANNKDITNEFVTKGQENIHQHFFIPYNIKPWYTNITWESEDVKTLKSPYDKLVATRYAKGGEKLGGQTLPREDWKPFYYFYSDTDPLDKSYKASITGTNIDVKFLGFENPIGFKGWFGFNNPLYDQNTYLHMDKCIYTDFELGIKLLHAATSKTENTEDGKPSPFDSPTDKQVQNDLWDVHLSVPVLIYASQSDALSIDWVEIEDPRSPGQKKRTRNIKELKRQPKFEELRDFSKDYVKRIALAFGISHEEAIADIYAELMADPKEYESGALFF